MPVLGICYGEQTICAQLGGKVEIGHHREFGRAFIEVVGRCALFEGLFEPGDRAQVWMSHGDKIVELPPGFRVVAISEASPFAAIADDARKIYGVQFHPEVVHTPAGGALLRKLHPPDRRLPRRLDDGALSRSRGRAPAPAGGRPAA